MTWPDEFLADRDPKTWSGSEGLPASVVAKAVFVQSARRWPRKLPVASSRSRPTTGDDEKGMEGAPGVGVPRPYYWSLDTRPEATPGSPYAALQGQIRPSTSTSNRPEWRGWRRRH